MLKLALLAIVGGAAVVQAADPYQNATYRREQFDRAVRLDKAYLTSKCDDAYGSKTTFVSTKTTTRIIPKTTTSTRTAYHKIDEFATDAHRKRFATQAHIAARAEPTTTAQKRKEIDTIFANLKRVSSSGLSRACSELTTRTATKTITSVLTATQRAVVTQRIAPKYVRCPPGGFQVFGSPVVLDTAYTWATDYTLACRYVSTPGDQTGATFCYYDPSTGIRTQYASNAPPSAEEQDAQCPNPYKPTPSKSGAACAYVNSCPTRSDGSKFDYAIQVSEIQTGRGWVTLLDCRRRDSCQSCQYNTDSRGFYGSAQIPGGCQNTTQPIACPRSLPSNYEKGYCTFPGGYPDV